MKDFQRSFGVIVRINAMFLSAAMFAAFAWWIWPSEAKYWGFGLLSIFMALVAVASLIDALKAIVSLYLRDKSLSECEARAKPQKNADLASDDVLAKAGVIDG